MSVARRLGWLAVVLVLVTACGSESTGRESPSSVKSAVQEFAPGPGAKVYQSRVIIQDAAGGQLRDMRIVVACKAEGGCVLIAPDGAKYSDVTEFVDDSAFFHNGDTVLVNANLADPGAPVRAESFTRSADLTWVWITGAIVAVLLVAALSLWIRNRRRVREDDDRLLREWDSDS